MTTTTPTKENRDVSRATAERFVTPLADVIQTVDGYALELELPGVRKDDLEITIEGCALTVTARRQAEVQPGDPLLRERHAFGYRRTFELDPVINTKGIDAQMNQGVLRINLPKSEQERPRRIKLTD